MNFAEWPTSRLLALYRIAKNKAKGAYPFFRDPYEMIALRKEVEKRRGQC
jgi:hypothetical protein